MKQCCLALLLTTLAPAAEVLSLEQAYDKALASDQSIAIAYAAARKAALEPRSALVRMSPTLNGSAGSNRSGSSGSGGGSSSQGGTSFSSNSFSNTSRTTISQASITLEQPLIDFTVLPAYRRGKLLSQSARLQYQVAIRQTLFDVATAFFDVLQQQRVVAVNIETLKLAEENLTIADKRAKAGAVTRTDVLRATASVEENHRLLIESESDLELKRNVLANILNLDADNAFTLVEPATTGEGAKDFDALLATAYARREDLQAQALAIQQDMERRKEIRAGYAPRISGQLSASTSAASRDRDSNEWQAGVSVQIPFMTGGQRALDVKTADLQIEQTKLTYTQLRKTVQHDVKTAWVNVQTLRETIKALQAQVAAAEQGYKDLQAQYSAGTAKSIDVLDALKSLNSARKDLAVQTYGFQLAIKQMDKASGVFQEQRVKKVLP